MAFDINNLVIDRPIRCMGFNSQGDVLFNVDQLREPTLSMSTETTQAVDARDIPIMEFDRSKSCTFSATQAVFDIGLLQAQSGATKSIATTAAPIRVPQWETVTVTPSQGTITLKKTPINTASDCSIPFIWELKTDRSLGAKYALADGSASETEFAVGGTTLTLPTGATGPRTYLIPYEYEATDAAGNGAVQIRSSADAFNAASKVVLQVLGYDVCDTSKAVYFWLIFDNAKLSATFDLTLSSELAQNFELTVMTNYCDIDRPLFRLIAPES